MRDTMIMHAIGRFLILTTILSHIEIQGAYASHILVRRQVARAHRGRSRLNARRPVAHAPSNRLNSRNAAWMRAVPRSYPYRSIYGHMVYPPMRIRDIQRARVPIPVKVRRFEPQVLGAPLQRGIASMATTEIPVLIGDPVLLEPAKPSKIDQKLQESTTAAPLGRSTDGELIRMIKGIQLNAKGILETQSSGSVDIFAANKELQRLFESASKRLRSREDEEKLKQHLIVLNKIQTESTDENFKTMEKQLRYIETIKEQIIRREVLKIFVKDIVEKSGVMNRGVDAKADVGTVGNLLSIIDKITDNLTARVSATKANIKIKTETTTRLAKLQPSDFRRTDTVAERIGDALSALSKSPTHVDLANVKSVSLDTVDALANYRGRKLGAPETSSVVGLSIFGEHVDPKTAVPGIRTTTESFIDRERAGGSGTYWTHLQSGLADLLCALCQQQDNQPCISRYCSENTVSQSTTALT